MRSNSQLDRMQRPRSPYRNAKMKQHVRSRSRSKSPHRSYHNSNNQSVNTSHNTSTVHTQYLWSMLDEIQIIPPLCIEMLKHEQRNMSDFKKSISKEKARINSQIQALVVQLNHMMEDYRLSLMAVMDKIYQQYISKYAHFKSQIMDINRLKDQIETEFIIKEQKNLGRTQNMSNQHTIKALQNGKTQLKKYQIISYIAEMQKEKVLPLTEMAQYLMILTEYDNGFFQPEEFKGYMNDLKNGLRQNLHQNLDEVFGYIRDPDNLVFKQQSRNKQSNQILTEMDRERAPLSMNMSPAQYPQQPIRHVGSPPTMRRQSSDQTYNRYSKVSQRPVRQYTNIPSIPSMPNINSNLPQFQPQFTQEARIPKFHASQPYLYEQDSQIQLTNKIQMMPSSPNISRARSQNPAVFQNQTMVENQSNSRRPLVTHSNRIQQQPSFNINNINSYHSQNIICPYKISSDSIRISEQNPFSFKSKSMDIILTCQYIDDNIIAVGNRDGSLIFYNRNGNVIKSYNNVHKSAICTLSLINQNKYLASGSDHPYPQIIVWNLTTYQLQEYCKFKQHKGAVTAIQCLQDGQHMISGSYDKKLCVYSIPERKLKYLLPSNKSSIAALTLNSNGNKLISCCLENNAINIWQIVRNNGSNGKVQTIFLQQIVENNSMICSVVASAIKPNIIYLGTKDGKLKIVDIDKGEAVKNMNCCNNALIQILVFEQMEGLPIVVCWPCKEKCFKIVDCETGKVTNVSTRGQLDFGCGVSPKATTTRDGSGFVVCSQAGDREIYWYKINRTL